MVTHYAKPQRKIRIDPTGSDDEVQADMQFLEVLRPVNAVDVATFILADTDRGYFNNTIVYGDDVAIYVNYEEEGALSASDLIFYGFVEDLIPRLSGTGEVLQVQCRHYARALNDMVCNQEYGTQSGNPTVDELHEILQDNNVGIIDEYVNDILDSGVTSGYAIDDTYIEEDTDSIKYVYFPFKPVKNCLDDLQLIFQALKTHSTAGWHWIVKTVESPADTFTSYFCLAKVADHELAGAPAIETVWPTYWNSNQANSTLVEGVDFQSTEFLYQRPSGNYVIYAGKLRKPGDGDRWTESLTGWDDFAGSCTIALDSDAADHKVGTYALNIDYGADGGHARYPSGMAEAWNIENWGGKYNLPELSFWIKSSSVYNVLNLSFTIRLFENWGPPTKSFNWLLSDITAADTWYHFDLPMGPYAPAQLLWFTGGGWQDIGGADWGNINFLDFHVVDSAATGCVLHVDGLQFNGQIIRGAKKLKSGGAAEDYYKQIVITDNLAKDDSGTAADDSYVMAQMAYGELLRVARRPLTGTVATPGLPSIMGGQLAHIHAANYGGANYRVNGDMRVLLHRLSLTPPILATYLTLTNDLINGSPNPPPTLFNQVLQATNPDFQNRQISSIKAREIDITQNVLEKTYQFNDYY